MDLREIGWGAVEWIHLAQDSNRLGAVVNAVMNLRVLAPCSYLNAYRAYVKLSKCNLRCCHCQHVVCAEIFDLQS
jgi:hypothetical protein